MRYTCDSSFRKVQMCVLCSTSLMCTCATWSVLLCVWQQVHAYAMILCVEVWACTAWYAVAFTKMHADGGVEDVKRAGTVLQVSCDVLQPVLRQPQCCMFLLVFLQVPALGPVSIGRQSRTSSDIVDALHSSSNHLVV